MWGQPPELFSIGLQSPVGEIVPRIPARLGQTETVQFILENTRAYVNYELVQNTSGSQLIFLRLEDPTPGIWNVNVYCGSRLNGEFHMWLPITGFVRPDVVFLAPDPYTTITVPAVSTQVITPGAYSAYTDSLFIHSSRGFTRDVHGKKYFIDHDITSIQDFIDPRTLTRYDAIDVNVYQSNIFHTKLLIKDIQLQNYLFNQDVYELPPAKRLEITNLLRREMIEIYSGMNIYG